MSATFIQDHRLGASRVRTQHEKAIADRNRKAVRYVASRDLDASDITLILDMLGLDPQEGRTDVEAR